MQNEEETTQVPHPAETDGDVNTVKPMWYWIKDSKGYGSVTVTLVFVAFWMTTLAYVLSIMESVGPVHFRPFDVGACAAYFGPIVALYFGRKFTEAKFPTEQGK